MGHEGTKVHIPPPCAALTSVSAGSCQKPALCTVAPPVLTSVTCFHCGDPCGEDHRVRNGRDFCCQGCEVVHDLLQQAGLGTYYELEDRPGVKQQSSADEQRAELFDLDEVRTKLVEFSENGVTRVRFHVPQMHCSSCIWLLENLDRIEPAVMRSRVSFA